MGFFSKKPARIPQVKVISQPEAFGKDFEALGFVSAEIHKFLTDPSITKKLEGLAFVAEDQYPDGTHVIIISHAMASGEIWDRTCTVIGQVIKIPNN